MKRADIFVLLNIFVAAGCGVKGAPMPRRDEVFIEKTLIQSDEETAKNESDEDKEKVKNKTKSRDKNGVTILPQKDPR